MTLSAAAIPSTATPTTSVFTATSRDDVTVSRRASIAGRCLSGLAIAFLGFDAGIKVLGLIPADQATQELGFSGDLLRPLGVIQLICLACYMWPRTRFLGAVLWTGYLGGAIATHVRVDSPLFSHTLFPIYIALLLWGGIWLRNPQLRALFSDARITA